MVKSFIVFCLPEKEHIYIKYISVYYYIYIYKYILYIYGQALKYDMQTHITNIIHTYALKGHLIRPQTEAFVDDMASVALST